jgi:hypothetical protein
MQVGLANRVFDPHRISMGRRQAAESANSALKGSFVDIGRKFFRVFGLAKVTVLLAFTVAAFNLDRVRSFLAKQAATQNGERRTRAKRRVGTWMELLPREPESAATPTKHPPG